MHVPATPKSLVRLAVVLSIVSGLAGVLLAVWMRKEPSQLPLILLGPTHAIAFVPLTAMISRSLTKTLIASALCLSFYVWGILGMTILLMFAPVACSTVWGVVIAWAWRRPTALLAIPFVGLLSTGAIFLAYEMATRAPRDGVTFPAAFGSWHALMILCIPLIVWSKPFPAKPLEPGTTH